MAILGVVDGAAYLDQLSVRLDAMKRGVGRALIDRSLSWASGRAELVGRGLWLNTYGHLPWNAPYYERCGFVLVPEPAWGPQMRALVGFQRCRLTEPAQRVVMQRPLSGP